MGKEFYWSGTDVHPKQGIFTMDRVKLDVSS